MMVGEAKMVDLGNLLELLIPTPDVNTTFTALSGQSGQAFWTSYDGLSSHQQDLAQTELWLDAFFCGWSPGDRTTTTDVVEVTPPLPYIPVQPPIVIPELSTWIMMILGLAMLGMFRAVKETS